jgi:hypothetical protein
MRFSDAVQPRKTMIASTVSRPFFQVEIEKPPERSYCVKSEVATNRSASASVLKVEIFFFILESQ